MGERLRAVMLAVVAILLALYVAQPYIDRLLFAATEPREITPRGDLAESERTAIGVFDATAPSVVQVAVQTAPGLPRRSRGGAIGHWLRMGHRRSHRHQRSCRGRRWRHCRPAGIRRDRARE